MNFSYYDFLLIPPMLSAWKKMEKRTMIDYRCFFFWREWLWCSRPDSRGLPLKCGIILWLHKEWTRDSTNISIPSLTYAMHVDIKPPACCWCRLCGMMVRMMGQLERFVWSNLGEQCNRLPYVGYDAVYLGEESIRSFTFVNTWLGKRLANNYEFNTRIQYPKWNRRQARKKSPICMPLNW